MAHPFSLRTIRRLPFIRGFTQLEILVIVFIVGIMATMVAPSFGGVLEAARMKQTTVEIRSAFQETQRQSIRSNQACQAHVFIPSSLNKGSTIKGSCLNSGDRSLPEGIGLTTNIVSSPGSNTVDPQASSDIFSKMPVHRASWGDWFCWLSRTCDHNESPSFRSTQDVEVGIGFGPLGSAKFEIATNEEPTANYSHSAKFIAFRPHKIESKKTCVVLSRSLGLTRIGTYQGPLDPVEITTSGTCQIATWTEQ